CAPWSAYVPVGGFERHRLPPTIRRRASPEPTDTEGEQRYRRAFRFRLRPSMALRQVGTQLPHRPVGDHRTVYIFLGSSAALDYGSFATGSRRPSFSLLGLC